jgi:hypothetical protein
MTKEVRRLLSAGLRTSYMLPHSDGRMVGVEGPPLGYDLTGVTLRTPDGEPYTDTKFRWVYE